MAKKRVGSTPATIMLKRFGVSFIERTYSHDPAETEFGREAARALGVEPERVFKTLLVEIEDSGDNTDNIAHNTADSTADSTSGNTAKELAVAIVPVTGLLDLKALASALGCKRARMADPALAERKTGYVVGGISPIGQRTQLTTVLDETARDHTAILVSGGRRGVEIELDPDALLEVTGGTYAAVSRTR